MPEPAAVPLSIPMDASVLESVRASVQGRLGAHIASAGVHLAFWDSLDFNIPFRALATALTVNTQNRRALWDAVARAYGVPDELGPDDRMDALVLKVAAQRDVSRQVVAELGLTENSNSVALLRREEGLLVLLDDHYKKLGLLGEHATALDAVKARQTQC